MDNAEERFLQLRTDLHYLSDEYQQRITMLEASRSDTKDPERKRHFTDRIGIYQSFISKLSETIDKNAP